MYVVVAVTLYSSSYYKYCAAIRSREQTSNSRFIRNILRFITPHFVRYRTLEVQYFIDYKVQYCERNKQEHQKKERKEGR